MPSQFSSRFSASGGPLEALHGQYGIPAQYSDQTEASVSCSLRIRKTDPAQLSGAVKSGVSGEAHTASGDVMKSEVAKPVLRGRFAFDGEVWEIAKTPYLVNGKWILSLSLVHADRRGSKQGGA